MKNSILLFLFLIPAFLFAQYPTTGNKSRLGWQTTGDGLIWRGVAGDTVNKPNNRNYPYFQLDTVNAVLYRYIQTRGQWQAVGGGSIDIDSLVYATRFWVNSNFFPLQGGLLTGTGGSGFVGFPLQSSPPSTPSTGFSLYAGSTGNNISWMQPDGFFRRLVSPVTGTPRQYQFMARSYTLGDSADIANNITSIAANYIATSNGTNLVARNLFDNNTYVGILNSKPFSLGQWTTAGRPSGVNGYMGYNTSFNWPDIYSSSGWFSPARAATTGGAFTAGYIPFGGTGGLTENADLFLTRTGSVTRVSINNSTANNSGLALLTGGALKYSLAAYQSGTGNIDFTVYNEQTNKFTILVDGTTDFIGYGIPYSPTYAPRYAIDISSTDAFALPRGTVAQRPTIASSTTPFRYNTDSTALEYGESVGTWRQLATRAYARSLVASLSPDTWLGTRLPVASVRIGALGNSFTLDSLVGFRITSPNHTSEFGNGNISQGKKLNAAGTKYYDAYYQYDSRSTIANGTAVNVGPSYSRLLLYNRGSSEEYEWTDMHTLDSTNNVFGHRYGAQYKPGFVSFRSLRPSAAGVYKLTPNFSFRVEPGGNGVAGSPVLSVFTGSDSLFSVKLNGTVEMDRYGTLAKTAAATGKTGTNINATFATDGTLLEIERKRDTTIYVTDADYNFSAAITSTNILNRYNRIVIYSKLSASSTSDNQIFLHTPSSDFLQCEIIIYSNDASADSDATSIDFTTNGAVDGAGGTLSSYAMSPGQRVNIRAVDDGGYKWFFN
jgi:hypothetical protein